VRVCATRGPLARDLKSVGASSRTTRSPTGTRPISIGTRELGIARGKTYVVYGGQADGMAVVGDEGEREKGLYVEMLGDGELNLDREDGPAG
jgi:hypothetical protein